MWIRFKEVHGPVCCRCAFPCYVQDVHNGHLYPLSAGLLFLQKPVLFFPDERIHELKFGRFGVSGARYVDLEVRREEIGFFCLLHCVITFTIR